MPIQAIAPVIQQIRAMTTRQQKWRWVIIALFAGLTSLLEVAAAFSVALFVQVVNTPDKILHLAESHGIALALSHRDLILLSCIGCAGIYVFKNLMSGCETYLQNKTIQGMGAVFRASLLHVYGQYAYQAFLRMGAVKHLEIFGTDINAMFTIGVTSLAACLSEFMVMLFLLGFLFYLNPMIAVGIFSINLLVFVLVKVLLLPKFSQFGKSLQNTNDACSKVLHHFFHGFKEVVIRGSAAYFVQDYAKIDLERASQIVRKNTFLVMPRLFLECLFMLTFVGIVWGMVSMNQTPDAIVTVLGSYLYIGFRLMPGVNRAINYISLVKGVNVNISRVYGQFVMLHESAQYDDVPKFHFHQGVCCDHVSFAYASDDVSSGVKPLVLDDVSFSIRKGQWVGIMGSTGSGKSTLLDVLLGILSPSEGRVTVDGFPVACQQWHQCLGFVPQSVYLFDGSIRDNIVFSHADTVDEEYIQDLIALCQLEALINRLPQGLDTQVGERGVFMSGGERQRIAIARALYFKPQVLIFDEATSALDQHTEENIMGNLRAYHRDLTVIMVAHRLKTLIHCDTVIHIENGKKVAEGSYEGLCL